MADFNKYTPTLKKLEGGFVDNPVDKGGATNKGVTLKTFRQYYGEDRTVEDLKNITEEQWQHIIKIGYWDKCKADEIDSQSVAEILVDWYVNSGVIAIKIVQCSFLLKADGVVGNKTLATINNGQAIDVFRHIERLRRHYYIFLAMKNKSQERFLQGWLNRLDTFSFKHW